MGIMVYSLELRVMQDFDHQPYVSHLDLPIPEAPAGMSK